MKMSTYNAEISAGSLMLPESRRIAKLLLENPTKERWIHALKDENILQKNPATALRQAALIRKRLETLDAEGWQLIVEGDSELVGQLLLAASIKHSQLLADFLRDVYAQDLRRLEHSLSLNQWDGFLTECIHRDNQVEGWATSTKEKLFQVIVRILVEAKYLDTTRKMNLTPPMIHPGAASYLKRRGDAETLSIMEYSR
ncbi:MAG: DUF1819 family protein [Sulfuriferula sp.]|nr:DUF1819 family protein [Sulfuriferula sp.]